MARRKSAGPSTATVVSGVKGVKRGYGKAQTTAQQHSIGSTRMHTPGKTNVKRIAKQIR